jgi:hypothetical protein
VRGIGGADDGPAGVAAVGGGWQSEVVRPLRAVRDRLKARLAAPPTGSIPARWPELTAGLRQRALAVEIDGERLEQLLLAELVADLPRAARPGVGLASRNLGHYRRFTREDRRALEIVLAAAFPDAAHEDLAAACEGLAP